MLFNHYTCLLKEILSGRACSLGHSWLLVVVRLTMPSRESHINLVGQVRALLTLPTHEIMFWLLLLGPLISDMCLLMILWLDLFVGVIWFWSCLLYSLLNFVNFVVNIASVLSHLFHFLPDNRWGVQSSIVGCTSLVRRLLCDLVFVCLRGFFLH